MPGASAAIQSFKSHPCDLRDSIAVGVNHPIAVGTHRAAFPWPAVMLSAATVKPCICILAALCGNGCTLSDAPMSGKVRMHGSLSRASRVRLKDSTDTSTLLSEFFHTASTLSRHRSLHQRRAAFINQEAKPRQAGLTRIRSWRQQYRAPKYLLMNRFSRFTTDDKSVLEEVDHQPVERVRMLPLRPVAATADDVHAPVRQAPKTAAARSRAARIGRRGPRWIRVGASISRMPGPRSSVV